MNVDAILQTIQWQLSARVTYCLGFW